MKLIDIVKDANENLLRSKARSILTIIAIFIGAMTLTITNGIGAGVSTYIDDQLGNLGAEDVIVVQQKMDDTFGSGPKKYDPDRVSSSAFGGGGPTMALMQEKDVQAITSVSGVISAEPFLNATPDYIVGVNGDKYQIAVSSYVSGTNLELMSGQSPDNSSRRNEIVLPFDYAGPLGFDSAIHAIGKEVTIGIKTPLGSQREVSAVVVGAQEQSLMSVGGANINDALMRSLVAIQEDGKPENGPGGYVAIIARVSKDTSTADMDAIKKELRDKNYDAQTFQDSIGIFKQVIGAIITVLNFFAVIALLAASFGIVNTLLMAVQERTKEIGLMKAMGLGGGKIFLLFSIEATLLGFWGSLLGSLAGIGIGQAANRVATNTFLKELPGFDLTKFSPLSVLVIMLIIMSIAFIAGTFPARRASRKSPIDALRYE